MKRFLFLVLCYFTINTSFSQESNVSVELNLPVLLGQNFYADNYTGVFDIGATYEFVKLNTTKIGTSLNVSFLRDSNIGRNSQFDLRLYVIEPKIHTTFTMPSNEKLHFKTGLGYSLFVFDLVQNENTTQFNFNENTTDNKNGVAINLGLIYDLGKKFYAEIQYDFVKLFVDENVIANAYNTNLNIFKIGVGIRI
jgi:hypothetical protein